MKHYQLNARIQLKCYCYFDNYYIGNKGYSDTKHILNNLTLAHKK